MSFLCKVNTVAINSVRNGGHLLKQTHPAAIVLANNTTRRNYKSSKNSDSFYKVVKSKVRIEDESHDNNAEGSPNWELFAPTGNRFYLPGSMGPAWQGASSSASAADMDIEQLIDFDATSDDKLQIDSKPCPLLLRTNLHELFPAPEVYNKGPMTLITLYHKSGTQVENGAKNFLIAAREMCTRLRMNGYWADFMNPFSGKPFYSYASAKKLYKIDNRFRGLGLKFESHQDCLIISADSDIVFTGSVFTNAPNDMGQLQTILDD